MICPAPAMRAAFTAARPTPPQPITATLSPGVTLQALNTAPAPVVTAQPSSAARSSGMSGLIATQAFSCTSIISASAERLSIWCTGVPSARARRGGVPFARRVPLPMHSAMRPVRQNSQVPQNTERQVTTASPRFTRRTSLPTASTMPAASCPGTAGRGWG
jgi:hypothetical protein